MGVSRGAHRVKVAAWIGIGMVAASSLSSERLRLRMEVISSTLYKSTIMNCHLLEPV